MELRNTMKKAILITILGLITISCSDDLSNSKAENIIIECLNKEPYRKTVKFQYGERLIYNKNKEEFQKLKELQKKGFLKIDSLGMKKIRFYGKYPKFNIKLLEKSKEYIIEQTESNKKLYVELLAFDYEVDEVKEVYEIPSLNVAEVRTNFKKTNVSPFSILTNENTSDFKIRKLKFKKTSNGWRYCE